MHYILNLLKSYESFLWGTDWKVVIHWKTCALTTHAGKSLLTKARHSECNWNQTRSKRKTNTSRFKKNNRVSQQVLSHTDAHRRDITLYYLSRSDRSSSAPGSLQKPAHRCSCRCHPPSLPVWRACLRSAARCSSTSARYTPAHPQAKRKREKI